MDKEKEKEREMGKNVNKRNDAVPCGAGNETLDANGNGNGNTRAEDQMDIDQNPEKRDDKKVTRADWEEAIRHNGGGKKGRGRKSGRVVEREPAEEEDYHVSRHRLHKEILEARCFRNGSQSGTSTHPIHHYLTAQGTPSPSPQKRKAKIVDLTLPPPAKKSKTAAARGNSTARQQKEKSLGNARTRRSLPSSSGIALRDTNVGKDSKTRRKQNRGME